MKFFLTKRIKCIFHGNLKWFMESQGFFFEILLEKAMMLNSRDLQGKRSINNHIHSSIEIQLEFIFTSNKEICKGFSVSIQRKLKYDFAA